MKAAKYILLTFFSILMVLPGTACSDKNDSEIRKAVSAELDPLKGLSPDEAYSTSPRPVCLMILTGSPAHPQLSR